MKVLLAQVLIFTSALAIFQWKRSFSSIEEGIHVTKMLFSDDNAPPTSYELKKWAQWSADGEVEFWKGELVRGEAEYKLKRSAVEKNKSVNTEHELAALDSLWVTKRKHMEAELADAVEHHDERRNADRPEWMK